ncbi:hypothetical protein SAMN04489761_2843 [Tenacibaculum sp. MAR_2009_124]|nr:hypothetical protein SAMN04489761_2843 [Tenacibaculum sp. MAR_2009_124]
MNSFFSHSTALKKETVAKAMLCFFALYNEKIIQLIYTKFLITNRINL